MTQLGVPRRYRAAAFSERQVFQQTMNSQLIFDSGGDRYRSTLCWGYFVRKLRVHPLTILLALCCHRGGRWGKLWR